MGPDTYVILGLLLALAIGVLAGRLAWVLRKGASFQIVVDRGKSYLFRILLIVLVLLGLEMGLMVLSESSYYDVLDRISWGAMRWRPSLEFGWLLVHRSIWILFVALALYFLQSRTRHAHFLLRHGRKVKEALLQKPDDARGSLPRGIKAVAVLQLLCGGYFIASFVLSLVDNLSPFDLEFWSYTTGFGSYEATEIARASANFALGLVVSTIGARLLYQRKDAWWVSLIGLMLLAAAWAYAAVLYFYRPTYGGVLTILICLVWMIAFALPALLVWRARMFYK